MEHILNLEQVKKYYGGNSGNITKAVDGISMYVDKGANLSQSWELVALERLPY